MTQQAFSSTQFLWSDLKDIVGFSPTPQYDEIVWNMLEEANQCKKAIELNQIIGRLQNKSCFLAEYASNTAFSLATKYQLLARYYYNRRNREMFAHTLASSVVLEWLQEVEELNGGDNFLVDSQPLVIKKVQDQATRKSHPSYRLRILALQSTDLRSDYVFEGQASTWLAEADDITGVVERWRQSNDFDVVELFRQGKTDNSNPKKRERGTSLERSNAAKKGMAAIGAQPRAFFSSFQLNSTTHTFLPADRNIEHFKDEPSQNVVFPIMNLALSPLIRGRSDAHKKYVLESALSLALYFHGQAIKININVPVTEMKGNVFHIDSPIRSMSFEITSNACTHDAFNLNWKILRSYYEQQELYPRSTVAKAKKRHPQGTAKSAADARVEVAENATPEFMYWKHIRDYLQHCFQQGSQVNIRKLEDAEIRTIQSVILSRRVFDEINKRPNVDLDDINNENIRKEIVRNAMKREFSDDIDLCKNKRRMAFLGCISELMYNKPLDDHFKIFEEDFTAKIVNLTKMERLTFSLCEWLHAIAKILRGDQLHTAQSHTTARLFNRHIISLRSQVSATKIVADIHRKNKANNGESVILLRFDEYTESAFVFHFADVKHTTATHAHVDALAIKAKTMPVQGSPLDKDIEKAVKAGVVDIKTMKASGLYVFLRQAYPGHFTRIFEHIGDAVAVPNPQQSQSAPQQPKRKASIVLIRGESNERCNPVYDFKLAQAPMDKNEIHAEQGPADHPNFSCPMVDITASMLVTSEMSNLSISGPQQPQDRNVTEQQLQSMQQARQLQIISQEQRCSTTPGRPVAFNVVQLQQGQNAGQWQQNIVQQMQQPAYHVQYAGQQGIAQPPQMREIPPEANYQQGPHQQPASAQSMHHGHSQQPSVYSYQEIRLQHNPNPQPVATINAPIQEDETEIMDAEYFNELDEALKPYNGDLDFSPPMTIQHRMSQGGMHSPPEGQPGPSWQQ